MIVTRAILIAFAYISMANLYCLHDDTRPGALVYENRPNRKVNLRQEKLLPSVCLREMFSQQFLTFFIIGIIDVDVNSSFDKKRDFEHGAVNISYRTIALFIQVKRNASD